MFCLLLGGALVLVGFLLCLFDLFIRVVRSTLATSLATRLLGVSNCFESLLTTSGLIMYILLNLMSEKGIGFSHTMSVLGYCLAPMIVLALAALVFPPTYTCCVVVC